MRLFAGSSHPRLAEEVALQLGISPGRSRIEHFPDGEIGVQILEEVQGKEIFLLQSPAHRPNHYLMELLVMVDALKRAGARRITALLPYYPYARQDRRDDKLVPITARLVADMLQAAGVCRVVTLGLHTDQIEGFFSIPVQNLSGRSLLVSALRELQLKSPVVVSTDIGGNRLARKFAEDLDAHLAFVHKKRLNAERVEAEALIGRVEGREVVLVDDICSTGHTLEMAARICRERGARLVVGAVTHGLFSGPDPIAGLDRFFVTDSIAQPAGRKETVVSCAPLLAALLKKDEGICN
ncbi:MAG: ribose-phosphate diphosphokinase [Verrucomicrobiota bacterium]|nr:ribose-phosphate diphosphokinase [Verrucomicrobiota bacterium]